MQDKATVSASTHRSDRRCRREHSCSRLCIFANALSHTVQSTRLSAGGGPLVGYWPCMKGIMLAKGRSKWALLALLQSMLIAWAHSASCMVLLTTASKSPLCAWAIEFPQQPCCLTGAVTLDQALERLPQRRMCGSSFDSSGHFTDQVT